MEDKPQGATPQSALAEAMIEIVRALDRLPDSESRLRVLRAVAVVLGLDDDEASG